RTSASGRNRRSASTSPAPDMPAPMPHGPAPARGASTRPPARRTLLLLLCLLVLPLAAPAATPPVDYLELAAVLTRDGAHDRAEAALANIHPAAPGLDLVKYHSVRGLLAMGRQDFARAADAFAAAVAAASARAARDGGSVEPVLCLHQAQALFGQERF